MRDDSTEFALLNEAEEKEPRYVIRLGFETDSIYLTSHSGITSLPGTVIENVLQPLESISQRIIPDEGRSEIGAFSFRVVDRLSEFTEEIHARLGDYQGLRDHRVRLYVGYRTPPEMSVGGFGSGGFGSGPFGDGVPGGFLPDAKFTDFQVFQTQDITGISFDKGVYTVKCADITRETRKEIFEPKKTTLRQSIVATGVNIPVYSTEGFTPIRHGPSFSDAPNAMAGYLMIEDEIIRYGRKSVDGFHDCVRGVFNTKAVAHSVDDATTSGNRPKVEEVIYLEMPAAQLAYAINTGVVLYNGGGSMTTLPDHWHLGIPTDLVKLDDFTGIGADLWDIDDETLGFIPVFQQPAKTDGKKWLEQELYMLMGCFPPIYYDGRIGLKRMNPVLIEAAGVVELNESNVVDWDQLEHDYKRLYNVIRVDWNHNGEEFTRSTVLIDSNSIIAHGEAPIKTLQFEGLRGWRHSDAIIRDRINVIRDRFSSPPQTITVTVLPSLNRLEVGDVVRLKLQNVRDFAGQDTPINRAMEIQRKTENYSNGRVTLELFGSTGIAGLDDFDSGPAPPLPDAYYTAQGTELSTICTIVVNTAGVGVIQPGTYNLAGHSNLRNATAIYYYDGELDVANGATIRVNNNVQLRVRGAVTVNGTIDGIGRGNAGVADNTEVGEYPRTPPRGISGYVGNSRGYDGVHFSTNGRELATRALNMTRGQFSTFPRLALEVVENALNGLPNDLRGTSGGAGGSVARGKGEVKAKGGTGADGGAGLALICRGLFFGASGQIDLSGDDSVPTALTTNGVPDSYPGAGGGGGPGSFLVVLDGAGIGFPDLSSKFLALTGAVPISGKPILHRKFHKSEGKSGRPYAGYTSPALISNEDLSNVANRVLYVPAVETAEEDHSDIPPAPTNLVVTPSIGANSVKVTVGTLLPIDLLEVYASITDDRGDSFEVASGRHTRVAHDDIATGANYFYWARTRRVVDGPDVFSAWYPESEFAGVPSAPKAVATVDIEDEAVTAVLSATVDEVEITNVQDTPDGQSKNTLVLTLSYTPVTDVKAFITVTGNADYTFDAAGTFLHLRWSVQRNDLYGAGILQEWLIPDPVDGEQYQSNVSFTRRYNLAAGEAQTFKLMANKLQAADDVFLRNIEMRLEIIKK